MKFKYMIRGLGLGIVITAAVMGAYSRNAVADARVAVLREYGFGDESRLVEESETSNEDGDASDIEPTEQTIVRNEEIESEINSVLDAAKQSEQAGITESGEQQPVEPSGDDAVATGSPAAEALPQGDAVDVEIVIVSGDDSGTIARKLYNAGVIENASEYDAFLMQHGYDKRLTTGTKTISITDSWQEIADKITR